MAVGSTTTTLTTTLMNGHSTGTASPKGQRNKQKVPVTIAAPPANGVTHGKTQQQQQQQPQPQQSNSNAAGSSSPTTTTTTTTTKNHREKQLPEKTLTKWLLRLFLMGVWAVPVPSLLNGGDLPLMFKVTYAVGLLYTVVYFGLRIVLQNELTIKRIMSGIFSLALGGLPMYVLYFEPEFQPSTLLHGVRTVTSDTAQGILLGFYTGDMFWITRSQLNIPSLLVHHISVICFWIFAHYQPMVMTICMLAQMQEVCNPFWYFHWIFFSSYTYKKPSWRFLFFLNAGLIFAGYVGLRLIWVQLRLTQHIWWMVWNYPYGAAFMVPAGIFIETVINALNIYKLSRSIITAWNTPVDRVKSN